MHGDWAGWKKFAKGGGAFKTPAWQRSAGKNPKGGLNEAGRRSAKREGMNLKPPVSASQAKKSPKAAARRKSFCARSAGQMKMYPEAAKDPNSRIRQARRRWKC